MRLKLIKLKYKIKFLWTVFDSLFLRGVRIKKETKKIEKFLDNEGVLG